MAAAGARKGLCFHDPASIADYYMERLRHEDQEVLLCMMLDTKNQLLGEKEITRGTVNATMISCGTAVPCGSYSAGSQPSKRNPGTKR